jgi:hypothetical protein
MMLRSDGYVLMLRSDGYVLMLRSERLRSEWLRSERLRSEGYVLIGYVLNDYGFGSVCFFIYQYLEDSLLGCWLAWWIHEKMLGLLAAW